MYNILCVEDSAEVQIVIKRSLASFCEVVSATTIESARHALDGREFDLIILDISLPDGDGLRFCSELKSSDGFSALPIFILTAKNSIQEKILGFQLGIEDFLVKPFDPMELKLRIESRLKKILAFRKFTDFFSVGNMKINLTNQRVDLILPSGDATAHLSTTEFKILTYLARNKEQVRSREQILEGVWGGDLHLSDRTIDSHISRIRKKTRAWNHSIEAVMNSGYRIAAVQSKNRAA